MIQGVSNTIIKQWTMEALFDHYPVDSSRALVSFLRPITNGSQFYISLFLLDFPLGGDCTFRDENRPYWLF